MFIMDADFPSIVQVSAPKIKEQAEIKFVVVKIYNMKPAPLAIKIAFWVAIIFLLGGYILLRLVRNQKIEVQPEQLSHLTVYYPLEAPKIAVGEVLSSQRVVESQIREIALQEHFLEPGADWLVRLAMAESSLNPLAIQKNGDWSVDRGLWQWNSYFHPEISDQCSFDVQCSTKAVVQAIKEGNLRWWSASLEKL